MRDVAATALIQGPDNHIQHLDIDNGIDPEDLSGQHDIFLIAQNPQDPHTHR